MRRGDLDLPIRVDERLRDRELGVLDLLTMQGVKARFPQEAERRRWLGKFERLEVPAHTQRRTVSGVGPGST
jgi:broad specificity phosphatase PhoE